MKLKQTLEVLKSFGVNYTIKDGFQICLSGLNLGPVDLSGACLIYADLTGTNLSTCQLTDADLYGAKYDLNTAWPADFDPISHGARMI